MPRNLAWLLCVHGWPPQRQMDKYFMYFNFVICRLDVLNQFYFLFLIINVKIVYFSPYQEQSSGICSVAFPLNP